jgi:murein L,D-transpeptidase YcbB/YkuD
MLYGIGCKPPAPVPQRVVDSTLADTLVQITQPNVVVFDSLQLDVFFANHPAVKSFEAVTKRYYQNRGFQYIWLPQGAPSELAYALIAHTEEIFASKHINDAYGQKLDTLLQVFSTAGALPDSQRVVAELLLTARYFTYVDKVVKGAVDESVANKLGWLLPRRKVSLTAMLDSFLTASNWDTFEQNAINSQYFKLRQALQRYRQLAAGTETLVYWPAAQKGIRAGDASPLIGRFAQRLTELGYLPALPADTLHAGPEIIQAVATAQKAYGLQQDSIIGRSLAEALNVPARERIKTLLVNMERMRWVPERINAQNLILVNIPDYKLIYYQQGKPVWNCRVVVGSPMHKTVIFSGVMDYVVFSPYWYVPQSIINNEIGLARAKSPAYLKRKNM